jgi:glycosyltransferase involved in cell wall biosynthesis
MKTRMLTKRWAHHSKSGGYDQWANYTDCIASPRPRRSLATRALGFIWRKVSKARWNLLDYQFYDFFNEIKVVLLSWVGAKRLVHVLYGDEQLSVLLTHRKLLRGPLVVSFHIPHYVLHPSRFEGFHRGLGGRIDAAIVLARSEVAPYEQWIGKGKVHFLPHGIDTDIFCPAGEAGSDIVHIVMVGMNYRDWDTARAVMHRVHEARLPVRFDIVVPREFAPDLPDYSNLFMHHGLSEEALMALYRRADLSMLPLLHATANNAALESMACGTPVASTDVGGMPDYVSEEAGWLFPVGDSAGLYDLIARICEDRSVAGCKREGARRHALTFDWRALAPQLERIYTAAQEQDRH